MKKVDYRFPWRPGNQFSLLLNGPQFFPVMLAAIAGARKQVLMEMYLIESGRVAERFVHAFVDAAGRGVQVQVLLDAFGSLGFSQEDSRRLVEGGVQLAFYNPLRVWKLKTNLFRTHRKLLVVDGELAYIGGAGISDDLNGEKGWRETQLEIRGPAVADWQMLFAGDWAHWSGRPAARVATPAPSGSEGQRGRLVCTGRVPQLEIKRAFLARVNRAGRRVWLATAYFIPSPKVRRALRRAANRGVDVRLLLPGPITDHPAVRYASRRFYGRLLRHGVRIFEYQGRFMHTKVALADNWATIGSSNVDRWNLRWNLEANQEVEDRDFAAAIRSMLQEDFTHCQEILHREWRRRSRLQRLREWLWGMVDRWLMRWLPENSNRRRNRSGDRSFREIGKPQNRNDRDKGGRHKRKAGDP